MNPTNMPEPAVDLTIDAADILYYFANGQVPAVGEQMNWIITHSEIRNGELILKGIYNRIPNS